MQFIAQCGKKWFKNISLAQVKTNVICSESTMTVEVEKASLSGFHEDRLQLSDPTNIACSLQQHSNSTHVVAVIPLNACGTQLEVTKGHWFHYLLFVIAGASLRTE